MRFGAGSAVYRYEERMLVGFGALLVALLVYLAFATPARADIGSTPDPSSISTNGRVSTILKVGDTVYIGGSFTQVNGVERDHLAAIDASTMQLTGWAPSANNNVLALAASPDGSTIYAGGAFTRVNGVVQNRVVALDARSGAIETWRVWTNYNVRELLVSGNQVYIGGDFTIINGQSQPYLALVNGAGVSNPGALVGGWSASLNGRVWSLELSLGDGLLYVGGDFTSVSGQPYPYLAALDPSTGALYPSWKPPTPNGRVFQIIAANGEVYTAQGGPGGMVGAYDTGTGALMWKKKALGPVAVYRKKHPNSLRLPAGWTTKGDGDVQAIALMGSRLYVGGHFIQLAGQPRRYFAAVDAGSGALDPNWAPMGYGDAGGLGVWAYYADPVSGTLYSGGDFTKIGNVAYPHFASFSDPNLTVPPASTPPDTSIDSGPKSLTNETSASFTFSSSAQGVGFECSLDGGAYGACSSPQRYTGLGDGTHTFLVRAVDSAGNVDPSPAEYDWTVDTVAPDPPVISAPANNALIGSSNVVLSGTAEPGSTVEVYDGGGPTPSAKTTAGGGGDWSITLSGVADGSHTYSAVAVDAAGNVSSPSVPLTVTVDTTPPTTSIQTGPSGTVSGDSATFTFSSSESGSSFQCSLDGAAFRACSSPQTYSGLSGGQHTFRVRAVDAAGNADPSPPSWVWTVDVPAPPDTSIDSGPKSLTNETSASFTFSSSAQGVGFECSLDGGAYGACSSPQRYTGLGDGTHTFLVRAVDSAGNVDPSPARRSWVVDTHAPSIRHLYPRPGSIVSSRVPYIMARVTDRGSGITKRGITLRVDGRLVPRREFTYARTGKVLRYPNRMVRSSPLLRRGRATVKIVVRDRAGNVSSRVWHFRVLW